MDWHITKRGGTCAGCDRAFDEDEPHVSTLVLRSDEPLREDLCQECFAGRPEEPAEELWWWRTRHRVNKKRGLQLDLEAIEGLFLALEKKTAESVSELRYVLCLILMRKRRLKIDRIVRDSSGEAMIVRRPRRKEALRVSVHDFTPERMQDLRGRLMRIFDGDEADVAAGGDGDSVSEEPVDRASEAVG